jgi:hypothetical protein
VCPRGDRTVPPAGVMHGCVVIGRVGRAAAVGIWLHGDSFRVGLRAVIQAASTCGVSRDEVSPAHVPRMHIAPVGAGASTQYHRTMVSLTNGSIAGCTGLPGVPPSGPRWAGSSDGSHVSTSVQANIPTAVDLADPTAPPAGSIPARGSRRMRGAPHSRGASVLVTLTPACSTASVTRSRFVSRVYVPPRRQMCVFAHVHCEQAHTSSIETTMLCPLRSRRLSHGPLGSTFNDVGESARDSAVVITHAPLSHMGQTL